MGLTVNSDEYYMKQALQQAEHALSEGEVPVGAVVVCENRIIAKAYNQSEQLQDATAHAEMLAITAASATLGSKYLDECTLYVTLEPCPMCASASKWSQVKRIVFAASDQERGYQGIGKGLVHAKAEVVSGILKSESEELLKQFFNQLRNK